MGQTSAKRTPKPKWLALRVIPSVPNSIARQTAAELKAYCRANHIPITGPVLAVQEYRVGPHPKGYCPSLPSKPLPTYYLPDQLPLRFHFVFLAEVDEACARPWNEYGGDLGQPFDRKEFCQDDEPYTAERTA